MLFSTYNFINCLTLFAIILACTFLLNAKIWWQHSARKVNESEKGREEKYQVNYKNKNQFIWMDWNMNSVTDIPKKCISLESYCV